MDSQAIAKWAEQKATPVDSPAYKRLTAAQLNYMRELAKKGETQTAIAERLGIAQSTVSYWLNAFSDTTELATEYLRGHALDMAKNVVDNGQARDHIQALKGVGALERDDKTMQIAVGISLPGLTFASNNQSDSTVIHKLSD